MVGGGYHHWFFRKKLEGGVMAEWRYSMGSKWYKRKYLVTEAMAHTQV
jgi:hypothetical protein